MSNQEDRAKRLAREAAQEVFDEWLRPRTALQRARAAEAKLAAARKALEYYANSANYNDEGAPVHYVGADHDDDWALDLGQIAREALAETGDKT